MKLLAITRSGFSEGEAAAICRLIDGGWERVHIRKPFARVCEIERLICEIPLGYRASLSLHDHFELAADYGLGGVHLNSRNPLPPCGWRGIVSRSCHSSEEVTASIGLDYVTLSPVFDSISKPGYHGRFNPDELRASGLPLERVYALGGVTPARFGAIRRAGFGGAAMLSEAWMPGAQAFPQKFPVSMQPMIMQFITHSDRGLEDVLRGGCRWVQLRVKDVSDDEFASLARNIIPLCRRYGATVIFDDRVNLVEPLGADGVHVGANDMPVAGVRALLGPHRIVGATANTAAQLIAAAKSGADYAGVGPFRFTVTKKGLAPLLGLYGYRRIMEAARAAGLTLPVVAIGGITVGDLAGLKAAGVDGVAVSGVVLNSLNPEKTINDIITSWKNS